MSDGARTELYEEILSMCMKHNMDDMDGFKNELYIIMNDFEITARTTEIALLSEDRNEQLLKKFIMSKIVKGCTDRTIEVYKKSIDFILRRIGKTADDITTDDIRFYLAVRQKVDKITRTTADNELRFLRSFFLIWPWKVSCRIIQRLKSTRSSPAQKKKKHLRKWMWKRSGQPRARTGRGHWWSCFCLPVAA